MDFENKIICGDALEVLKTVPDAFFDLVITSPPYNLGSQFGHAQKKQFKLMKNFGYDKFNDDMIEEDYIIYHKNVLQELWRIIKNDGAIFYNRKFNVKSGNLCDPFLINNGGKMEYGNSGQILRQIIIWNKGTGIDHKDTYFAPSYENIYLIAKPKFRLNEIARKYTNIWHLGNEHKGHVNPHPAPFPIALPYRCIECCYPGHGVFRVLDPFIGSGSTALACKASGVYYTGVDINSDYVEMAKKRLINTGFDFLGV